MHQLFKPGMRGLQPLVPVVLKLFLFACLYVCMCVCLYAPLRQLITSGMIWCDIDCVRLVKPILQLFSLFLSINWMGVALLPQHVMYARQRYRSRRCTSHGRRRINYLAVATRWSASVINVSG